jgi:aminoglycoside phosphotransferase (APT) family kinase protein
LSTKAENQWSPVKTTGGNSDAVTVKLQAWLAERLPDAGEVKLSLSNPSGSAGFSGETYLATLGWQQADQSHERKMVVRTETTEANAPESDFHKMVTLQKILGDIPNLAVPKVYWAETDSSVIGGPFFMMEYVEGRAAPDTPPLAAAGWVHDASPEQRQTMYRSGIQFLTQLHKLDWRELGVDFLMHEGTASTQTRRHLENTIAIYDRAMAGQRTALAEATIDWLNTHAPETERLSICWGDARAGNILWRNFECVAALDWELCTLAEPAQDLAWWRFFEEGITEGIGLKRLPGMPDWPEMVAIYEEYSGNPLENLAFHQVFAGFRALATMTHMLKRAEREGFSMFGPETTPENNPMATTLERVLAKNI